jgi:hypothetical protein
MLALVLTVRNKLIMHPRRQRSIQLCALLACALALLVAASPAAADTFVEESFQAAGQSEFVVPKNVTEVEIAAVGAPGTDDGVRRLATPGLGAEVFGILAVTPGETLYPEVDIGGGAPGGGGYSALALCPQGDESCSEWSGLPWYLTEPIVAAGGGAPGELAEGAGDNNPGGNGGLLGAAGGAGKSFFVGGESGGGGAGLTQVCTPGEPTGGNGATAGTRGLPEGLGGTGGAGFLRGGGGGAGYIGGCGGGGGGTSLAAGAGGGGGGASFANNPALTDFLGLIPTVTGYGSETPVSGAPAEVTIDFEDPNVPRPDLQSPKDVQVGARPLFSGVIEHESDDERQYTLEVEQTSGVAKGGMPFHFEKTGTAAANGAFTVRSPVSLPSGRYQAQVSQTLVGGGNEGHGLHVDFTVDATPPLISLSSPVDGAYGAAPPADFTGVAGTEEKDEPGIVVQIATGPDESPVVVARLEGTAGPNGEFSIPFGGSLPDGTYKAFVSQQDDGADIGDAEAHFTVDTVAPSIALTDPAPGASVTGVPVFRGTAGTASGDLSGVQLAIYRGATITATPVQAVDVAAGAGGAFEVPGVTELAPGTYTALASQRDLAGNEGRSTATFTVPSPRPGPPASTSPGPGPETHRPSPAHPSVAIIGKPRGVAGAIHLKLKCDSGAPCHVALTGTTVEKPAGKVAVAHKRLTIAAGKVTSLAIALDGHGRRLLRELGHLQVKLGVALPGAPALHTVVRLAGAKNGAG